MTQSEESITLITSYRLPHHDSRSFTFVQDDVLPSYTGIIESARRKELLAHVVRLRILACRNDLNRKRIFSLQLTAHSSQLTAISYQPTANQPAANQTHTKKTSFEVFFIAFIP